MMRIGELADTAGVSVETIRYYERRGLLERPERTATGYRQYGPHDVERLGLLLRAKDLGFTLGEIGELLGDGDGKVGGSADHVAAAVRSKLDAVEAQIDELLATRCRLRQLVDECDHGDGSVCVQLRVAS